MLITAARPNSSTSVFLGLNGVPEQEVVLAGNDFQKDTVPMKVGAVHVHLH